MRETRIPDPAGKDLVRQPRNPGRSLIRLSIVVYGSVILVTALAVWAWHWLQPPPQIPGMVYIPAGMFLAGSDKHSVKLHAFYIDATEVSNAEYSDFCEATGCTLPEGARNLPVVNVTIEQARAYARWSHKRLPTALEWERAARGTSGALFPWGDAEDPSRANVSNNSTLAQHALMPVRSFGEYPAFQMIGNAWEMVEGEITPSANSLRTFPRLRPPSASGERWFAIRGGSYQTPLTQALVWEFDSIPASYAASDIGFRCAKDPQ
ncbi:MAG TPA: SUMF1/EgtB/PvdO family nonheme iron enzyme [Bryobacteraceae bacterium]|nr:SUMF1/EgtB/PvdO family nonheme iron enzyme [Bryobacteraceae bacterium]